MEGSTYSIEGSGITSTCYKVIKPSAIGTHPLLSQGALAT